MKQQRAEEFLLKRNNPPEPKVLARPLGHNEYLEVAFASYAESRKAFPPTVLVRVMMYTDRGEKLIVEEQTYRREERHDERDET